ncbi:elongation factor P [Candidatus Babeliales bacterium]|nr:elongation factor P [Candidatus Babeliales bacterium]MCF7899680.1 elongation factor P [Candidatus Babeliales bacterium]
MISTSDFKRGSTKILWNNEPWLVVEFHHVKPGKGGAFVRTKLKNLITDRLLEETFRSGEKFPEADLESKNMQFLYADDFYHFMDQETFEQVDFDENHIESIKKYLKEGEIYSVLYFEGKPISAEPPMFMVLTVKNTIPGVKGDTAQGGSKPATLESGIVVSVPLFINEGDKIKVDTRQNKYIERII